MSERGEKRFMVRESIVRILICCLCWLLAWPGVTRAQEGAGVELQIRLRASDGSSVVGEPVVLQRLPEEEDLTPACLTDTGERVPGACGVACINSFQPSSG
jgi:hypothetical protein